jgi:hypothetical protein
LQVRRLDREARALPAFDPPAWLAARGQAGSGRRGAAPPNAESLSTADDQATITSMLMHRASQRMFAHRLVCSSERSAERAGVLWSCGRPPPTRTAPRARAHKAHSAEARANAPFRRCFLFRRSPARSASQNAYVSSMFIDE